MMLKAKGILLLGVLCASLASVFVRWATAPSLILVLYRMSITACLLLPGVLRNRQEFSVLTKRHLLLCVGSGVVLGLHFVTFFEAVRWTSLTVSTVLASTEVLFVALGTVVFFRKRLSGKAWLAILLTFAGSAVVAMGGTDVGVNPVRGNFMALLAAILMAMYTMLGAVCRRDVSTTLYTFLAYLLAAVTVLAVALVSGTPLFGYGTINYVMALCLAVCCTLLGHSVYAWALKYLSAAVVAIIKMASCVFLTIWGMLFFQEYPGAQVYIGGVMVILGIIVYNLLTHKGEVSGAKKE